MEDDKIVQCFLDRDESAIRYASEKYGSRLRSISYGITLDREVSEECENDTYMEAWKTIPPNEPRDYLYAFLARIIRHISIDHCRKRSALKRVGHIVELSEELESCIPGGNDIEEEIAAQNLGESINRYLRSISKEKRILFMRRYFYLDSISEIAKRMSFSESKVKTALMRIRNGLLKHLEQEGYKL